MTIWLCTCVGGVLVQDADSAVNLNNSFTLLVHLNFPESADVDTLTSFYAVSSGE